jgi:hypothetical protein
MMMNLIHMPMDFEYTSVKLPSFDSRSVALAQTGADNMLD